jgi:mannose/fructose/N-acetylgalactosamine-specific phosphotransferase system component IIC
MTNARQIALAVLASSVSALPVYLVLLLVSGDLSKSWAPESFVITLGVSLVGVIVIGLPIHFMLSKLPSWRVWHYVIAGFLTPATLALVFAPFGSDERVIQATILGGVGACVAWVFIKTVSLRRSA